MSPDPTIRAAVQVLTNDGLVVRDRGRSAGYRSSPRRHRRPVSRREPPSKWRPFDLIERNASPALQRLVDSLGRLQALGPTRRGGDVVEADVDFHESLVAAAASPRLLRLFHGLANETRLVIALQR